MYLSFPLFWAQMLVPLSTLFSDTLSLCPSLNVRDHASHPHKQKETCTSVHDNLHALS
jgi:hypothetical protein